MRVFRAKIILLLIIIMSLSSCDDSSSGGGSVFVLGQGRFVSGAVASSGTFGDSSTTSFHTVNLPAGTLVLHVVLQNQCSTDALDIYVGQPNDQTLVSDYDFGPVTVSGLGSGPAVAVNLISPPGNAYPGNNNGDVTIAVHRPTGAAPLCTFFISTFFEPFQPDTYEPNETQGAATFFPAFTSQQGYGLSIEAGDHDYYDVVATAGDTLFGDIYFPHGTGTRDLQLEILDSLGIPLATSNTSSPTKNKESVSPVAPTDGTYTIHVFGNTGSDASPYLLLFVN